MLRFLTAGESHGQALVVVIEGLPAGLSITVDDIQSELARRRLGYGRGPRMRFEQDEVTLLAGVRHGRTLGSPVAIEIGNSEWEKKWTEEMSPAPGHTAKPLTAPRPGHADLAGMQKYDFVDARDVLERASARETAARVAAGAVAKALLACLDIEVVSHVVALGSVAASPLVRPGPGDLEAIDRSQVRCLDPAAETAMVAEIKAAAKDGDSLGGVVEVLAYGLPVGLGSHVHWDRKLDGLLAQALMSIQAVKGVEIGDGFAVAARRGSEAHDPILWDPQAGAYRRDTTRAGGLEGGISTGELLVAKVAMKPLATLNRPALATVDTATKEETVSFKERTDVTAVPAMGVVAETMVALVLAGEVLRKFGGDSVGELVRNHGSYLEQVRDANIRTPEDTAPVAGDVEVTDDLPLNWDAIEAFSDLDLVGDDASEADGLRRAARERLRAHVVLVGMMGSGKTSVGERLASQLGLPFVDSDRQVEARTGRTVREIFEANGEAAFRFEERAVLEIALDASTPSVIAAAGGAVTEAPVRDLLRNLVDRGGHVVWLRVDPAELVARVESGDHRPLLADDPESTLERLYHEREGLYRFVADIVVEEERGGRLLDIDQVVSVVRSRLLDPLRP
jgi:chorismate synthase